MRVYGIQPIVRNSELSASACAAATGLGMAAAGGRMTLDFAARFGAVGKNIAVLRELSRACEIGVCCGGFANGLHLPAQDQQGDCRDDERS